MILKFLRQISVLFFGITSIVGMSQVKVTVNPDVILTQHWAMPNLLNPASTGDIDFIRVEGGARIDYLGSHASPKNYLATADSPFKIGSKRIGAGIVVNSNSFDLYRNFLIGAQGSYKFKLKKKYTLSVGIQLGYYHTKFKGSDLILYNNNQNGGTTTPEQPPASDSENGDKAVDPGLDSTPGNYQTDYPTQDVGAGTFDVGVGVKFEHPKFYAALSAMHLTNPTLKLTKDGEETTESRYMESKLPMTLYFEGGGNIGLNNSLFTLQPSLLIGSDFKRIDAVAEMRATYNKKITFGVDYRWNRAAGVVAGLFLKDFYLGYSWEYDYSAKPKGSTGNHELVIGYRFKMDMGGKNMFSHRSIRIM